jgi:hypothetical protein
VYPSNEIRYDLTKPQVPSKHNASLAVLTHRLSLLPENIPGIAPATLNPGNPDIPSDGDKMQLETAETTKNSQITATSNRFSRAIGRILTPKAPSLVTQEKSQPPATK